MVVCRQLQVLAVLSISPGNRVCLDCDGEENVFAPFYSVELSFSLGRDVWSASYSGSFTSEEWVPIYSVAV